MQPISRARGARHDVSLHHLRHGDVDTLRVAKGGLEEEAVVRHRLDRFVQLARNRVLPVTR